MLSDIIVASTLFLNGIAVLNFNFKPDPIFDDEASSFASKTKEFVHNVRYFRLFIGLWNFVVIALMFTFFGG
ncbi:unnamed protein product [Hymenolepis diminuta]|uniref:Uncharacterized protein n=1 Tax=Hymenolepis diminuta TaxID=6216 RepID=A0A564YB71_HYMDI|nr:unnamed protein product [Hymenolepis diminuta]